MVDAVVAAQLQQWTFEKPTLQLASQPHQTGPDSAASTPSLCDDVPETLRIDAATVEDSSPMPKKDSIVLQDRYLSSEEDLSPAEDAYGSDSDCKEDYDDDVVIHEVATECRARTMSISRWDKGRSCDMAVLISYARVVGRPKVIQVDCRSPSTSPARRRAATQSSQGTERSSRPSSRAASPSTEADSPRQSSEGPQFDGHKSTLHLTDSTSTISSFQTAPSTRSVSPFHTEDVTPQPSFAPREQPPSTRSSLYNPPYSRSTNQSSLNIAQSRPAPQRATPSIASTDHSFLNSDPYENQTTNAASPIIKPGGHKRLRSISMKLALAKIAITPAKKMYDARINGRFPPTTPSTPYTPNTPQSTHAETASITTGTSRLRRASTMLRPKSRHGGDLRDMAPESAPPMPTMRPGPRPLSRPTTRMLARGADEREPTLVLPPCPDDSDDDPMEAIKSMKLRKRRSFMDLL